MTLYPLFVLFVLNNAVHENGYPAN